MKWVSERIDAFVKEGSTKRGRISHNSQAISDPRPLTLGRFLFDTRVAYSQKGGLEHGRLSRWR